MTQWASETQQDTERARHNEVVSWEGESSHCESETQWESKTRWDTLRARHSEAVSERIVVRHWESATYWYSEVMRERDKGTERAWHTDIARERDTVSGIEALRGERGKGSSHWEQSLLLHSLWIYEQLIHGDCYHQKLTPMRWFWRDLTYMITDCYSKLGSLLRNKRRIYCRCTHCFVHNSCVVTQNCYRDAESYFLYCFEVYCDRSCSLFNEKWNFLLSHVFHNACQHSN